MQNQLEREEINVYASAKTHQRDLEAPPVIDIYLLEGCYRTAGMKMGAVLACPLNKGQIGRDCMKALKSILKKIEQEAYLALWRLNQGKVIKRYDRRNYFEQ